jgi:hypothetical protein
MTLRVGSLSIIAVPDATSWRHGIGLSHEQERIPAGPQFLGSASHGFCLAAEEFERRNEDATKYLRP